jgi:hypothetical protein
MRSGAKAPPGFRSPRSAAPPTAHSTHILPALVLLRKPLFGLAKRRIQSERYVPFFLKFSNNIFERLLTNNIKEDKSNQCQQVKGIGLWNVLQI